MPECENFDVFLSYSHDDGSHVEELAKRIDDRGLKVWIDKWVLVPGGKWQPEIAHGLRKANACAVCIGERTPSGWFKEEIERALNLQTNDASFRVIPILLPGAQEGNVDNFLELRTWVDFRNGVDDRKAFHYLICGINGMSPGRFDEEDNPTDTRLEKVRKGLINLKRLHAENLIDDNNLSDYRCRILDKLVETI
jgi:hypothetical protein